MNLLSVAKITDKGHKVIFDKNSAKVIHKNALKIFEAKRVNNM